MEKLLTVDELADYLKKPKATLYSWSSRGEGPPGMKVGRDLRYRLSDVEKWLKTRDRVGSVAR